MRLTNALHCAMIVGLLSPALVRADDVGVDIAATAYDFESKPDNSFIIADMGTKVGYVRNDSGTTEYWGYERFDFGEGATHLTVRASSATGGGTLHVRLASHYNPFTTVATVEIPNTGGWDSFQDFTVPVDPEVIAWLNGRTLFFVVEDDGNEDYKFDIESFRFDDVPSQPTNAAQYSAE
ncbi:MAG: carbohydrate-binding protein, partial [Planctomycetota bacterium]